MRRFYAAAGALLAALAATGCTSSADLSVCPAILVVPGLDGAVQGRPGAALDPNNLIYVAKMNSAVMRCEVDKKTGDTNATVTVHIAVIRGAPDIRDTQLTYFAAVADDGENILTKKVFDVKMSFPARQSRLDVEEILTQHIKVPKGKNAHIFTVLVGFQTTPEERDFIEQQQKILRDGPSPAKPG